MENYLLITLGHNSSAIFVDNSQYYTNKKPLVIGYEEERFSRIKADSQFPIDAINEIIFNVGLSKMKGCKILISHWFNFVKAAIPNKYITFQDINFLAEISTDVEYVTEDFTHHDAHAYSAYEFRDYFKQQEGNIPVFCIVADGFGNNEEVLSIYRRDTNKKPQLLDRVYGYEHSLGLFYQYATSAVGMKENQDEYKFLGYEAHIDEELDAKSITYLIGRAEALINEFSEAFSSYLNKKIPCCESMLDYKKLDNIKQKWHDYFADILEHLGLYGKEQFSFKARTAVAFLIQRTVERVISKIVISYNMKDICLAGGLFYNVKLNNRVLKLVKSVGGTISIMPLAGDQGAAIGMYASKKFFTNQFPFDTLAIGPRRLYNIKKYADDENIIVKSMPHDGEYDKAYRKEVAADIAKLISQGKIVDLICGNMEFGPRALCNTSSLFLPSPKLTAENNANNLRNEVMPCAPVIKEGYMPEVFDVSDYESVIGSTNFMICTLNYGRWYSEVYGGVMHKETLKSGYTGRPQVVQDDSLMGTVLSLISQNTNIKCLVNTSFNVHGNPIVFDTADILSNYKFQCEHAEKNGTEKPVLYILN